MGGVADWLKMRRNTERDRWKINNWHVYVEGLESFQVTWNKSYHCIQFDNSPAPSIPYSVQMQNLLNWIQN